MADYPRFDMSFGPVSGDEMAEWCEMLRDDNAIHLRREAAEAAGFGSRRVNPGPANLAYLISAALMRDPEADFAEIAASFVGNVLEEDLLAVTLEPAEQGSAVEARLVRRGAGHPAPDAVRAAAEAVLTARFAFREGEQG